MNPNKLTIIFFALVGFVITLPCFAQKSSWISGQSLLSPDNRYSLKLTFDPSDISILSGFTITDTLKGTVFQDDVATPLYSIKWSRDSKTVVFIVHVSGGSEAAIYHLHNDKWFFYLPEPTLGSHFAIIGQEFKNKGIELSYKVHDKHLEKFYINTFIFNPENATRTEEDIKEIDSETYAKLPIFKEKD